MTESRQKWLARNRKPRVHITMDVETEDGIKKVELPFVVGVMGDFSGDPREELKPLKDRNFIRIDRDNFDEVMERIKPGLQLRVPNTLKDDGSELPVDLKFDSMEDFEPANVARQVEPLKKLLDTRSRLHDLASQVDRSQELEAMLEQLLQDSDELNKADKKRGGKAQDEKQDEKKEGEE